MKSLFVVLHTLGKDREKTASFKISSEIFDLHFEEKRLQKKSAKYHPPPIWER